MGRPAKHQQQRFQGVTYYWRKDGYYKAAPHGEYLHRAVWVAEHGPIPNGFDVHHVNEDRADCSLGNLELQTVAKHRGEHAIKRMAERPRVPARCEQCGGTFVACFKPRFCSDSCRTLARMARGDDNETRVCAACGGPYVVNRYAPTSTCSRSCGATARWAAYRSNHQELAR